MSLYSDGVFPVFPASGRSGTAGGGEDFPAFPALEAGGGAFLRRLLGLAERGPVFGGWAVRAKDF